MKIFGIVGWKNSGKTTLMERLVAEISSRGLSVSTIKHAHHAFDVDRQGKDSFRHREAGAQEVLVGSGKRWALMHELRGEAEPSLSELLSKLTPVDLVLVEGYKRDHHPKLEARRSGAQGEPIWPEDQGVVAIATDSAASASEIPHFDLNAIDQIADFILDHVGLSSGPSE